MQTQLNTYVNVKTPSFTKNTTNIDWLNQIISPDPEHLLIIKQARETNSRYLKSGDLKIKDEYAEIKRTLPAVTWNATFSKSYKLDVNFKSGTGFIYIDVDHKDFTIDLLDLSKVYCYHQSVGGIGYSILCRVDGITVENYRRTFYNITDDLCITKYIDPSAVKLSQASILSYDSNLFINNDCLIYSSVSTISTNENQFVPNTFICKHGGKHNESIGDKLKKIDISEYELYYTNHKSFDFNGQDYITNWDTKFDLIECWLPRAKLKDCRWRTLFNYVRNLVYLNPAIPYQRLVNVTNRINNKFFETPMIQSRVDIIVKTILKQKNQGTLTPKITKKIFLINPVAKLDKSKLKVWGEAKSQHYKEIGYDRLTEIIADWNYEFNGKITVRSVATNSDMNKKTVEKYWSLISKYVAALNDANQEEIKLYRQAKSKVEVDATETVLNELMTDMNVLTLNEDALVINTINYIENY
jgi:hypothetical protein